MGGFVASGSADTEAGLQVRVVESGRNGAGRGVEVERRLEHGVEGGQHDDDESQVRDGYEDAQHEGGTAEGARRPHDQHGRDDGDETEKPETDPGRDVFAPCPLQERRRGLEAADGAVVVDDDGGDDQERGRLPGHADHVHDEPAEPAGAFPYRLEDQPDGAGEDRPWQEAGKP